MERNGTTITTAEHEVTVHCKANPGIGVIDAAARGIEMKKNDTTPISAVESSITG